MQVIRNLLQEIVNNIDAGNSNIPEEKEMELIEYLSAFVNPNEKLSKYQACKYLNVSRASFDNYVKEGRIPKGRKQQGFKELFYYRKDLDTFKESFKK